MTDLEQQRIYQSLVKALSDHIVSCNLASLEAMDTDAERDEAKKNFANYGTDVDIIEMILEGVVDEATDMAKEKQGKIFK